MFAPKLHILCSGVSNSDLMRLYINCTPCSVAKLSVSILQLMLWHYQEAKRVQRTGDKFPEWPDLHPLRLTSVCLCSSFPQPTHTLKTHTHTHSAVFNMQLHACLSLCTTHKWTLLDAHFYTGIWGDIHWSIYTTSCFAPLPQRATVITLHISGFRHPDGEMSGTAPLSLDPDSPAPDGWSQTC